MFCALCLLTSYWKKIYDWSLLHHLFIVVTWFIFFQGRRCDTPQRNTALQEWIPGWFRCTRCKSQLCLKILRNIGLQFQRHSYMTVLHNVLEWGRWRIMPMWKTNENSRLKAFSQILYRFENLNFLHLFVAFLQKIHFPKGI